LNQKGRSANNLFQVEAKEALKTTRIEVKVGWRDRKERGRGTGQEFEDLRWGKNLVK